MANIQDVANAAGVSTATVSRVLSHPAVVAEPTRIKVLRAVAELEYAPNNNAKSLRTTKTSKILITVPNISNPFFSSVIRGAEQAAQAAGYAVLLGDTHGEEHRENEYATMLNRKEADGIIFLGHRLPTSLQEMVNRLGDKAPIVNGCEFSPELGVASVHIDNSAAADHAMSLIFARGHKCVGVVTGTLRSPLSRDRLTGASAAARRFSAIDQLKVMSGDFSIESGARAATTLIDQWPEMTAIFCFSDEMAIGALSAIRAAGKRCPEDISLVGFDDIRYSQYLDPPLTTVSQPMEQIGRGTVELLVEILAGRPLHTRSVTLPHQLVERASLGTAP